MAAKNWRLGGWSPYNVHAVLLRRSVKIPQALCLLLRRDVHQSINQSFIQSFNQSHFRPKLCASCYSTRIADSLRNFCLPPHSQPCPNPLLFLLKQSFELIYRPLFFFSFLFFSPLAPIRTCACKKKKLILLHINHQSRHAKYQRSYSAKISNPIESPLLNITTNSNSDAIATTIR